MILRKLTRMISILNVITAKKYDDDYDVVSN